MAGNPVAISQLGSVFHSAGLSVNGNFELLKAKPGTSSSASGAFFGQLLIVFAIKKVEQTVRIRYCLSKLIMYRDAMKVARIPYPQ